MRPIRSLLATAAALLLGLLLAGAAGAAVVTTNVDMATNTVDNLSKNTQATINATENVLHVTVDQSRGKAAVLELYSPDTDWILRTTTADSTTDKKIDAKRTYRLPVYKTADYYFVRQSADGTLVITPLER